MTSSRQRVAVVAACFVCQLGLGYAYLFSPLLREVTADLGWSRAEFAAARAPYLAVLAAASAAAGTLTLRFGARPLLMIATACLGGTFWILAGMQTLRELYLANLLWGLFMAGLGDIVVAGVLTSWIERRRGMALGFAYAASNLGGMMLPPLFAWLTERGDWRSALSTLALLGVVTIAPFAWIAGRRAPARAGGAHAAFDAALPALTLRAAMATRSFWVLAVALASFFAYFLGVNDAFFAVMMDAGWSRTEAAGLYSAAVGAGGVSKVAVGLLADRVAPKAALVLDYALLAASALCLLLLPSMLFLVAFLVSYGLAVAARDVVYPLVVGFCFGVRTMPQVYGALMLVLAVSGTLGSVLTQLAYETTGSYRGAFAAYAVLNFAVLLSLALVRREARAGDTERAA